MNNYFELLKYLKVCFQNITVLHRHILGKTFYKDHEILDEYGEFILKMSDDLIEIGLAIGVEEPTIDKSIETYDTIQTVYVESSEAFIMVSKYFNSIIELCELAKTEVPDDVKNKLEEYEYYLRKEANYKIKNYLGDGYGTQIDN